MILSIKCKYSGQPKKYDVSDSLCELKGITPKSPLIGETDTAYIYEVDEGKRRYLNKSHCKKVILYENERN